MTRKMVSGLVAVCIFGASEALASLTTFQTFSGANYGVSTSGWGSANSSDGTILTSVPVGAELVAAYLYTGYYTFGGDPSVFATATLNGTSVAFGPPVNNPANSALGSRRADVTSIVQAALTAAGGPSATPFGLAIHEGATSGASGQDGEMLVTVYKFATGPDTAVGILDGSASVTGDTAILTLGAPATASTMAEMMIGDNFSCCGQESTIMVNGTTITSSAGNNDDCVDGGPPANGCLITVGTRLNNGDPSVSDPFSPLLPTYDQDHERYDLSPEIHPGDMTIRVDTINASQDDNIFAAVFQVTGDVTITTMTPEPSTFVLFGGALVGLVAMRFRRS